MGHIFISHVEEDQKIALEIAKGLEEAGYTTWYYERDGIPGVGYLEQVGKAIDQSQAIILIISPDSLGSNQVTNEVVRAYESRKPFIPVLQKINHDEFQRRQPIWRQALGDATSITIPPVGVSAILPRIIAGISSLGIHPIPGILAISFKFGVALAGFIFGKIILLKESRAASLVDKFSAGVKEKAGKLSIDVSLLFNKPITPGEIPNVVDKFAEEIKNRFGDKASSAFLIGVWIIAAMVTQEVEHRQTILPGIKQIAGQIGLDQTYINDSVAKLRKVQDKGEEFSEEVKKFIDETTSRLELLPP